MVGSGRRLFSLGIAIMAISAAVLAQEVEVSDTQVWVDYRYRQNIAEELLGGWSLGYRKLLSSEDVLGDWSRFYLRGEVLYSHSKRADLEGGLGGFYTSQSSSTDLFELRTWQGAIIRWPETTLLQRQLEIRHRFRLEQRWIRQTASGETDFGSRFRYRLATYIPLNTPTIESKTFYLRLMGEGFADLSGEASEFFAADVRLTTGLGYILSQNWGLEFRYTAQKSRDTVLGEFSTTDHILDFRIRSAVRIRDINTPW